MNRMFVRSLTRSFARSFIPSLHPRKIVCDSAYARDLLCHVRFGWDAIIHTFIQCLKCYLHTMCAVISHRIHMCDWSVCEWVCCARLCTYAAFAYISALLSLAMYDRRAFSPSLTLSVPPHSFMRTPSLFQSLARYFPLFFFLLWIFKSLYAHIIISYFLAARLISSVSPPHTQLN